MQRTVVLFGEAEKGNFEAAYLCNDLIELCTCLGEPSKASNSQGLNMAIQTLMYNFSVIYFRVEEAGYSVQQYLRGLDFLNKYSPLNDIKAIGLPGVGNKDIIQMSSSICGKYRSLLLFSEKDLYDLLTH